ncbi:MAG: YebC/PmpR family DNA-binding transcriptional regulator [Firmicutes bacterium]|nr:YebC/PmpR family DNA-binding transcriptional regulator [Bacillota bacterium]
MAGHSKWSNIKHRKAQSDAQKAKVFSKMVKEIMTAARAGGGDPESNFRLRLAINKAKAVNMPADNINRAIKRGLGEVGSAQYENILYEGYGPGGVACLVETLTDNRNRTGSEIRHIFSRNGGNLGETGCVSWMFALKGLLVIPKTDGVDEEKLLELAMEAGAENVYPEKDCYEMITAPEDLESVRNYCNGRVSVESAEIVYLPKNTMAVSEENKDVVLKLIEELDEHDDVQNVYTNIDLE